MTCDAHMRPFRTINDTELTCRLTEPHHRHNAVLENYAYEGSKTAITWDEDDRRNYHGEWPGDCAGLDASCLLPAGHTGNCAA